jgi:hypothetical protein
MATEVRVATALAERIMTLISFEQWMSIGQRNERYQG